MWPSVRDLWEKFSTTFEGYLPYMYLDRLGLVTTGMGNLIDPLPMAQALPWKKADGTRATAAEIGANWQLVKARQDLKGHGGGAFKNVQNLHLDDADIQALINSKLDQNDKALSARFPGYPSWPADAQMGTNSMSWAMGSHFNYPKFQQAVTKIVPDFKTAAIESYIPDNDEKDIAKPPKDASLRARNLANKQLFLNAQAALDNNIPHEILQWAEGAVATAEKVASAAADEAGKAAKSPMGIIGGVVMVLGLGYAGYKMYQNSKEKTEHYREPRSTMLPEAPRDEIHELGENLDRVSSA